LELYEVPFCRAGVNDFSSLHILFFNWIVYRVKLRKKMINSQYIEGQISGVYSCIHILESNKGDTYKTLIALRGLITQLEKLVYDKDFLGGNKNE